MVCTQINDKNKDKETETEDKGKGHIGRKRKQSLWTDNAIKYSSHFLSDDIGRSTESL